jgi:hypothetical protein
MFKDQIMNSINGPRKLIFRQEKMERFLNNSGKEVILTENFLVTLSGFREYGMSWSRRTKSTIRLPIIKFSW